MNPRAGLDGCRKSCSHRNSIPGPSSPWQVATPTTISDPLYQAMRRRIPENRRIEINLLFVFGHSQIPGAWSPGHLKVNSVAPNIFSIITAVLIILYKKCVSSEAPSTTREISRVHRSLQNCGAIMESVLVSTFGRLEYGMAPRLLGKLVEPCFMGKQNTVNAVAPRKKKSKPMTNTTLN